MTGVVSSVADEFVLGNVGMALAGLVSLAFFVSGAETTAIVTKISEAEIRTTHMTGIVTDLGIELGRLFYWNRHGKPSDRHFVKANRDKLFIHGTILFLFFFGGIAGAWTFKSIGFSATIPIAVLLILMAASSISADFRWNRENTYEENRK